MCLALRRRPLGWRLDIVWRLDAVDQKVRAAFKLITRSPLCDGIPHGAPRNPERLRCPDDGQLLYTSPLRDFGISQIGSHAFGNRRFLHLGPESLAPDALRGAHAPPATVGTARGRTRAPSPSARGRRGLRLLWPRREIPRPP